MSISNAALCQARHFAGKYDMSFARGHSRPLPNDGGPVRAKAGSVGMVAGCERNVNRDRHQTTREENQRLFCHSASKTLTTASNWYRAIEPSCFKRTAPFRSKKRVVG